MRAVLANHKHAKRAYAYQQDHSLLVEIFLWEKDNAAAWDEALAGDCSRVLWLKLAAQREHDHPQDAIDIYLKQIDPLADQKNNVAYEDAARLLGKIKLLMIRLGQATEFAAYLGRVRVTHKPKRNFMKLLDQLD